MSSVLWAIGRTLQFIALIQVAAALLLGIQTSDATLELKLLLFGVIEFVLGLVLVQHFGKQKS